MGRVVSTQSTFFFFFFFFFAFKCLHLSQQQAHLLRADKGQPFSSFFFSLFHKPCLPQRDRIGWQGRLVFLMPLPMVVSSIQRSSISVWTAGEGVQMRAFRRPLPV